MEPKLERNSWTETKKNQALTSLCVLTQSETIRLWFLELFGTFGITPTPFPHKRKSATHLSDRCGVVSFSRRCITESLGSNSGPGIENWSKQL